MIVRYCEVTDGASGKPPRKAWHPLLFAVVDDTVNHIIGNGAKCPQVLQNQGLRACFFMVPKRENDCCPDCPANLAKGCRKVSAVSFSRHRPQKTASL